ncbi:hypothetical protein NO108_02507 [Planktothrix rubescens]|nr:hypothetical protein NO108_02507 [Planktothrix rubescens]
MGSIQADVLIPNSISSQELDAFLENQFESCKNLTKKQRDRYLKAKFDLKLGRMVSVSDSFFMFRYDGSPEWELGDYGVVFFIILRNKIQDIITIEEIEEIENKFRFYPQCHLFIYMLGRSDIFQKALSQAVLILAEQYGGIIGVNRGIPIDYAECIGWYDSASFRNLLEENRIYFVP